MGTLSESFLDSTILRQLATGTGVITGTYPSLSLSDQTGLITINSGAPDSLRELTTTADTLSPLQTIQLRVRLIDSLKNAVPDSVIHFAINSGFGTLSQATDTTDALGNAGVLYTAPTTAGVALVDAYLATLSDTAKFTITTQAGALSYYTIVPSTTSDTAAAAITVTVSAYDVYGNLLDDDTTQTRLDVTGSVTGLNGSRVFVSSVFNTLTNGQHVATVRDSVRENVTVAVSSRFDNTKTGSTGLLTIRPASPFVAEFYPDSISNLQSGQLGAELIDSSAVIVRDRFGNAVSDTSTVRFVALGNGSTAPSLRTTMTDGIARTKWTLRTTTTTSDTMYAIVPFIGDSLRFIAQVLAAGTDSMMRVGTLADTVLINTQMTDTFRVKVEDEFSNPVTGRTVTFTVFSSPVGADSVGFISAPGVYVTTLDTVTDAGGFASAVFHSGTKVGTYILRASNPALLNPVIRDTVYARHRPAASLQLVQGNNQSVQVGSIATDTLVVRAFDLFGNVVTDTSARIVWRTIYNGALAGGTGLVDVLPYTPSVFVDIDSVYTNSGGYARAIWQVRRLTGLDTLLAFIRNVDTVQFGATTSSGAVATLTKVSGDSMTGIADGSLLSLTTRAEDIFGNRVNNATVKYSITSGNARFPVADSSFTNALGLSDIRVQLGSGDSVTVHAQSGAGSVDFRLYNLVYVDSSLFPDQIARDTVVTFRVSLRNNGPYEIRLDTNQTQLRFTDGVNTFAVHVKYPDSSISGRTTDSLHFIGDTVSVNFLGSTYTPKIDVHGKVVGSVDSLSGTLETNPNELAISAVELVSITIPAPKIFSRGDTLIVELTVRNTSVGNLTTTDYGLEANRAGVFQRVGTVATSIIGPNATSILRDTIRILPSAPIGITVFDGFYLGTAGAFTFSDTAAGTVDSLTVQSGASLRYLVGTLAPDTISVGQSASYVISIVNDSAASVNLDRTQSYLKFGADSTFLFQSQGVTGGGDTTVLTFASKALALASGVYRGALVLRGLENGGVFDTTLSVGTPGLDSLVVQSAISLASLVFDSVYVASDTSAQGEDSLAIQVRITNAAQADAIIDSIRLNFRRGGSAASGYSTFGLPSLPVTLAGGGTQLLNFYTNLSASADTGSIVLDGVIGARDANSNTVIVVPNAVKTDSVFARSRARLWVTSVTTPANDTVTLGQSGIAVNVTLKNSGGAPARLSDVLVVFKQGLYDTTLSQVLPDTIYGYESLTYNFSATVRPNSSIGLDSLGAEASGVDLLTGNAVSVRATGLDTLRILTSTQMSLNSVTTLPLTVSRDQDSVLVRVTVRNLGASVGRLDSIRLLFFDETMTANTTDFDVTPYSDVSDTLNAGVIKTFDFRVNIDALADTGRATIDAVIVGTDVLSGASFYDSAAATNDSWLVQFPTALSVDTVMVSPTTVLRGRQNIPVTVRIRNSGEAIGTIDSVALVFFYGATLNTTDFADTQIVPVGTQTLGGGDSVVYSYTVDVGATAPTGFARIYAHAHGRDNNSNRVVVDTGRVRVDSVEILTPPVLSYVLDSVDPDTVNNGSVVRWTADIQNTGGSDFVFDASTELAFLDIDSQKVNLPDTLYLAAGNTRTLRFNSVIIALREDSVYYPRLRYQGIAAGESLSGFITVNDSVKILRGSLAVIDSLDVYRINGTLTTTISNLDSFIVRMKVRNTGGSEIRGLAPNPSTLTVTGTTIPFRYFGPSPSAVDLAAGDSAKFEWRFRTDSSGVANFAVRVEGTDVSNDSLVVSNTATAFVTVTAAPADTVLAASPLQDSVLVYNFVDLQVRVLDANGLPASEDSVRFRVVAGAGGFNDSSRVTTDTVASSNTDGFASMRLFTNTLVDTYTVTAKLMSTSDDSVIFTVRSLHQGISYMTMTVNSAWTAGTSENVLLQAFDQYGNPTRNSTQTIQLSATGSTSIQYTPLSGNLPLTNGQALFSAVDTVATGFLQIKATASLGTEINSPTLTVRHAAAHRFADTIVVIPNTRVGNTRVLTTTVLDLYGNPVKDTSVTYSVIAASNGGTLLTAMPVVTDAQGRVSASYKTGTDVGFNQVRAVPTFASFPANPDTVYYNMTTLDFDANAVYEAGTLQPRPVTRNQIVGFRATFRNTGNFPLTLNGDSTYIRLTNTGSGRIYQATLDTTVNRTIAVNGLSQIFFAMDTVDVDAGRYPSANDSIRIFLWGTIFDSASVDFDTLKFTFGNSLLDTVRVLQPAALIVDSVKITPTLAVRGQDSIAVRYYARNTGEVTATTITVTDSFANLGNNVTSDWVFLSGDKPDTLAGGSAVSFTQYYRIRSAAALGSHYVSSRLRGIDKNDVAQVTVSQRLDDDSIRVIRAGNVQVIRTVVDSVFNDPFINVAQQARVRGTIYNAGDDTTFFRVRFASDGGGLAYTATGTLAADDSVILVTPFFATRATAGVETYSITIDSAYGRTLGDTLAISDPIAGNTRTLTVQDSARIRLDVFVGSSDSLNLVVSDSALFRVFVTMSNIGGASLSADSALVQLSIAPSFPFSFPSGVGVKDSSVWVKLNQVTGITLRSYDSTAGFYGIRGILDTGSVLFPRDLNNGLKSAVANVVDSVRIRTRKVGLLTGLALTVTAPSGATDDTISTFQQYTVTAQLTSMSRLTGIRYVLTLPAEFSTTDSLAQEVIPNLSDTNLVSWRVFSIKDSVGSFTLSVQAVGEDTTTGSVRTGNSLNRVIHVVRRADLAVQFFVSAPVGAKDDTVSTDQPLTVTAVVTNLGQASTTTGQLTLNPAGFVPGPDPLTQTFTVGDSIHWRLTAPALPNFPSAGGDGLWRNLGSIRVGGGQIESSAALATVLAAAAKLTVNMTTVPVDGNSGSAVHVINPVDTLEIIVVQKAIISNLTVTLPGGRDTVSTGQVFTVRASFDQISALTLRSAQLQLPNSAYLLAQGDSLTRSIGDQDTFVVWTVTAPDTIVTTQENGTFTVTVRGEDENNTGSAVSPVNQTLDVVVQRRTQLEVEAQILEPANARDGFISSGQSVLIRATVQNSGVARTAGAGSLRLRTSSLTVGGRAFTARLVTDSLYNLSTGDNVVEWFVTAPDTVASTSLVFDFGSTVPLDVNTQRNAFIGLPSTKVPIATEAKSLQISRVATTKDTTRRAVYTGKQVDSVLVFKLENFGPAENTNEILTQRFIFYVEEVDPQSGQPTTIPWDQYIQSIAVHSRGRQVGASISSVDSAVVEISRSEFLSKSRGTTNDLTYGILTSKGEQDTVTFSLFMNSNAPSSRTSNFRLVLRGVDAYDYDSLAARYNLAPGGNFQPLGVFDPQRRRIPNGDPDFQTEPLRILDANDAGQEFFNYPNPFGNQTRPTTRFVFLPLTDQPAKVDIYTLSGRLVISLDANSIQTGVPNETVAWDGRNGAGEKVRNGVYIAVLRAPGQKRTTKVLVLR